MSCSADKLGYNYQPVAHADEGLSFLPGSGQVIGELPSQVLPVQSGEAVLSQPIEAPVAPQIAPLVEEFQKEFYSYAAPEEQYDEGASNQQIANSLKRTSASSSFALPKIRASSALPSSWPSSLLSRKPPFMFSPSSPMCPTWPSN